MVSDTDVWRGDLPHTHLCSHCCETVWSHGRSGSWRSQSCFYKSRSHRRLSHTHLCLEGRKVREVDTVTKQERGSVVIGTEEQVWQHRLCPRRRHPPGEAKVRAYILEVPSFLSCCVRGGETRTQGLDKTFILFSSQILHPCHFSRIFSIENGKTLVCIWTFLCQTSAFRIHVPCYPRSWDSRLCSAISDRTPRPS